jgi:hypothetical protein
VLSVLALIGALFYAGRETAHHTSRQAKETAIQPTPAVSQPASTLRAGDGQSERAVIPRTASDADDTEIDDFKYALQWTDRVREVVARENPNLDDDDARHLGEVVDPRGSDVHWEVGLKNWRDNKAQVTVASWDGFSGETIGLRLDLKAKRVMAGADSWADVFPQPQPAWTNIEGTVELTSWDWTPIELPRVGAFVAPDRRPIVIEYDLRGRRGREPCSSHGKVVLAR